MDQTKRNLEASDFGGELDPHGADLVCNQFLTSLFAFLKFSSFSVVTLSVV